MKKENKYEIMFKKFFKISNDNMSFICNVQMLIEVDNKDNTIPKCIRGEFNYFGYSTLKAESGILYEKYRLFEYVLSDDNLNDLKKAVDEYIANAINKLRQNKESYQSNIEKLEELNSEAEIRLKI